MTSPIEAPIWPASSSAAVCLQAGAPALATISNVNTHLCGGDADRDCDLGFVDIKGLLWMDGLPGLSSEGRTSTLSAHRYRGRWAGFAAAALKTAAAAAARSTAGASAAEAGAPRAARRRLHGRLHAARHAGQVGGE